MAVPDDLDWVRHTSSEIGGPSIVAEGTMYDLTAAEVLVAKTGQTLCGFASFATTGTAAILLGLLATRKQSGIGSTLLAAVQAHCLSHGANLLKVHTTNDNLDALRFYQRRGFRLTAITCGGFAKVAEVKHLPPDLIGDYGITIRDELCLEKALSHEMTMR